MRILLDTHTFIWWDTDQTQLSAEGIALLKDPLNDIMLSVVSLWEITVKYQLGKLAVRAPLASVVQDQLQNGFALLPVTLEHVLSLTPLPLHHRDPFDRLLIAQAIAEQAVLLTRDSEFGLYPVQTI